MIGNMLKAPLLLFLLLFSWASHGIGSYAVDDTLYVCSVAGLKLRSSARISAGSSLVLPYSSRVVVKELTTQHEDIEEVQGYKIRGSWVKVSYAGKEGYVFDGYLSSYIPPGMAEGTAPGQSLEQYLQTYYKGKTPPMPYGKTGKEFNALLDRGIKWMKRVGKDSLEYGRLQIADMTVEEAYLIGHILCRSSIPGKVDYSDSRALSIIYTPENQLAVEPSNKVGLSLKISQDKEGAPLIIQYRMMNGADAGPAGAE